MVYCTLQVERLHKWAEAVNHPELGVEYLAYPHRHVFHIKAGVCVKGDDREIEFISMKHELVERIEDEWGTYVGSCEMMADEIIKFLKDMYPNRCYFVEVSEDGENGVIVRDGYE